MLSSKRVCCCQMLKYVRWSSAQLQTVFLPITGDPVHCCVGCLWRPQMAQLCQINERKRENNRGRETGEKEEDTSTCNSAWAWIQDAPLPLASPMKDTCRRSSCLLPSPHLTSCAHWLAFWTGTPTTYPHQWQHSRGLYICGTKPALVCISILWRVAWCIILSCNYLCK